MSNDLYSKCLELSINWDCTEDIVRGCVDLVSKAKDTDITSAKVDFGCAKAEIRRLAVENADLKKLVEEFTSRLRDMNFDYAGDVYYKSLELIQRGMKATGQVL